MWGSIRRYADVFTAFFKEGAVQLYRSLGVRGEQVMEIVQMKGPRAYANYCEAYNDCAPNSLSRFHSVKEVLKYPKCIEKEEWQLLDERVVRDRLTEMMVEAEEERQALFPSDDNI